MTSSRNDAGASHVRQFVGLATAQLRGERVLPGVARMFGRGRWALHDDGRVLFVPAPGHARDDLFPLAGNHRTTDGSRSLPGAGGAASRVEVSLAREVDNSLRASVTGVVGPVGDGFRFVGRYVIQTGDRVFDHQVSVPLGLAGEHPERLAPDVDSAVPLPAVFCGTLSGTCDGVAFAPVPHTVSVLDPVPGTEDPVEVLISPVTFGAPGELLWMTGMPGPDRSEVGSYRVRVLDGSVEGSVFDTGDTNIGITISVPHRPLGTLPAVVDEGKMVLRFGVGAGGTRTVTGEVTAVASALGVRTRYQATITGQADDQTVGDLSDAGFDRVWRESAPDAFTLHPVSDNSAPDNSAPDSPVAYTGWRAAREEGFRLALASRHREALPPLQEALAGCRAEASDAATSELLRESLLVDEINILTRLLACHRQRSDLAVLVATLREAVAVQRAVADRQHLAAVGRTQASLVITALTGALEEWRSRLADEMDRIAVTDASADVYEGLAEVCVVLRRPDVALAAAERGRGRTFADLLASRQPTTTDRPHAAAPSPSPKSNPNPRTRLAGHVEALGLADLRQAVHRYGATVVEYQIGASGGLAWVITPDGEIDHFSLDVSRRSLSSLVATLPTALRSAPDGGRATLAELYSLLVRPLPAGLLPAPGSPLAIVAHGPLFGVPFCALLDAQNDRYLLDRFAVVTTPSIGTLAAAGLDATVRPRPTDLLALVNPHPMEPGLQALPELEETLGPFSSLFADGRVRGYVREQATVNRLAEATSSDVVLLGTHGVADARTPAASFIALAPGDGQPHGRAAVADVAGLELEVDLVVLLACWTAAGTVTSDGVLGLSRAFLLAGARGLLSSLWTTDTDTGPEIVYQMLDGWLRDGATRAEALRRAQADLANQYPDQPLLWAPFQLTGAWT